MATERIDIVIREDGSRVVQRRLSDIGKSSKESASSVDFLKRALGLLGGALVVNKIRQYADAWSSANGLIATATKTQAEAVAVQEKLFESAQRTRTAYGDMAELYSRVARAGSELGTSQAKIIEFTEGVGKALAVQHTSADAARGALLQLGQALSTSVVRAEEFNSINEATPYILQVVAKNIDGLDGSIAKLRARMLDGKLTSKEFFEAFLKGQKGVSEDFGKASLTIGQSVTLVVNALTKFIGEMDKALGVSDKIGTAAKFIAANFDSMASAVGRLTIVLLTGAVAWGTYQAAVLGATAVAGVQALVAYYQAVASGNFVLLGSAEAERQKANALLASATAEKAALVQTIARTDAEGVAAVVNSRVAAERTAAAVANLRYTQAQIVAERQLELVRYGAQINDIGRAKSVQRLIEIRQAELALTKTIKVAEEGAAAAQAAAAAASAAQGAQAAKNAQALSKATAGVAGAQAAAAAATSAAVGSTSLFAQAISALKTAASSALSAVGRLFLLINANPFTVLAVSIVVVTGLLLGFGDKLDAGIDGITNMSDVLKALGEVGVRAFTSLSEAVMGAFSSVGAIVSSALASVSGLIPGFVKDWLGSFGSFYSDLEFGFAGVVRGIARTLDAVGGLLTGVAIAVGRVFSGIPDVVENIFKQMYNKVLSVIEDLINKVIEGVNEVRSMVGASLLKTVEFTKLEVNEKTFEDYGQKVADSFADGFASQGGYMENAVNGIFDRAQQISRQRAVDLFRQGEKNYGADLNEKMGAGVSLVDQKGIDKAKNALRQLLDRISPVEGAILEMARATEVLNEAQARGLITGKDKVRYLGLLSEHYKDIIDPLGKVNRDIAEEAKLLGMSADAREAEGAYLQTYYQLLRQGIKLDGDAAQKMRDQIAAHQELARAVRVQDSLLADSVERRKDWVRQLDALKNLLGDPNSGFKQVDALRVLAREFGDETMMATKAQIDIVLANIQDTYNKIESAQAKGLVSPTDADRMKQSADLSAKSQLQSQAPDLFEGTQEQIDLQLARFQQMYTQIDLWRQADLVSEQTAIQMRKKVDQQAADQRLKGASDFFGTLATLQSSSNKKIAAIGRAAAITQATIDGILAVQKALASYPPPLNYAMAAAVGVAAAANVAKIAGFEQGGYTGNVGTKTVAGVVHGREFVVNADATSRNRAALETMNAGGTVGGGGNVSIVVNNNAEGTRATTQERSTPSGREVQITIETVIKKDIQSGGPISSAMESQFGLNRAHGTVR